jgi:hypothetical protein
MRNHTDSSENCPEFHAKPNRLEAQKASLQRAGVRRDSMSFPVKTVWFVKIVTSKQLGASWTCSALTPSLRLSNIQPGTVLGLYPSGNINSSESAWVVNMSTQWQTTGPMSDGGGLGQIERSTARMTGDESTWDQKMLSLSRDIHLKSKLTTSFQACPVANVLRCGILAFRLE